MNRFEQMLALWISAKPGRWKKAELLKWRWKKNVYGTKHYYFYYQAPAKEWGPHAAIPELMVQKRTVQSWLCISTCFGAGKPELPWKAHQRWESGAPGVSKAEEGKPFSRKEWQWVRYNLHCFATSRDSIRCPHSSQEMWKPGLLKCSLSLVQKFISLWR